MIRNEEIQQAASNYVKSDVVRAGNEYLAYGDFVNGAKWADEHPANPWHDVNDELPRMNHRDEFNKYSDVVICRIVKTNSDIVVYRNSCYFEDRDKRECAHFGGIEPYEQITHWMYLPKVPKSKK